MLTPTKTYSSVIPSPVDENKRNVPSIPLTAVAATVAVVPIWAFTILPLSITYQIGRKILQPVSSSIWGHKLPKIDSGYKVEPSRIKDRSQRKYDVVVLGATGFTGKLAVRHLATKYGVDGDKVKWAIAGRSQEKLDKVKKELGDDLKLDLTSNIDCIVCDTSVPSTMPKLVQDTRAVATTAGPYALYGNAVVEFCAKFGTHYADITGETSWVQAMLLQWQETAQKTGARLVSFCGHDSVPWDISVYKIKQTMKKECNDDLEKVVFWDEAKGGAPGGTLATAFALVEGRSIQAPKSSFDPFLRLPDGKKSKYNTKLDIPLIVMPTHSPWTTKDKRRWTVPFIMAPVNGAVVRWSHALLQEGSSTLHYTETQVLNDFQSALVMYLGLIMFASMLFNPITAYLLKHYILPKPGEGPNVKDMMEKHFGCVYGQGIGTKGYKVESILYFDKDVGCIETSRMLIESALTMALEEDKLIAKDGGFYSPAAAMGDALLDRIINSGTTTFECRVVKNNNTKK